LLLIGLIKREQDLCLIVIIPMLLSRCLNEREHIKHWRYGWVCLLWW
jgi:hypothetical protein